MRILDVGACGTLFAGHSGVEATAIDLCPQEGNADVMQCDFLQLAVGAEGSEKLVEPSDTFPGGALRQLPAASYDAVALSLVLSYLPTPTLRGAMIRKARRLLPIPDPTRLPSPEEVEAALAALEDGSAASANGDGESVRGRAGQQERRQERRQEQQQEQEQRQQQKQLAQLVPRRQRGLLLVVDTFSVDQPKASRTSGKYLTQWIAAIEAEGFTFLRHRALMRSHALAFVTRHLTAGELEAVRAREPPALRMRREERGTPWQGPGTESWPIKD